MVALLSPSLNKEQEPEENQNIDLEKCKKIAGIMLEEYRNKKGVFFKPNFPEELHLPNGMEKGSEEQLRYITLTVSISFIRDGEALQRMTYKTFMDDKNRWIFDPSQVVSNGQARLSESLINIKDQRPRKDAEVWFKICKKLGDFQFKIKNLLEKFDSDAVQIYQFISENKKDLPYFAGQKIKSLWLRVIDETAGIKLKNMNKIPIPVDVHIARLSLKILYNRPFEGKITDEIIDKCQKGWEKVLRNDKIYPCQLDEPLWIMGKYNLFDAFIKEHNF
jgi:hypothetical protein